MKNASALDRTFVALDNMSLKDVRIFLKSNPEIVNIKIGLELFLAHGPQIVHILRSEFQPLQKIFLDLKLHDIPQTVRKSIQALSGLPVDFLTVHLSGGREMLLAALQAQQASLQNTKLLGVSFLTSLDQHNFQELWGIKANDIAPAFQRLFSLALDVAVHGLILSPLELAQLKGKNILKITPGIRFAEDGKTHDQKRIATFEEAFNAGADYIVIGRSLTECTDIKKRLRDLASFPLPT
ncbi:MAG: orotidine 5'-phosphate decarboxylase [Bdellovibrionales bacterium GWA2_49_15]|nr:MAG: orotidine 5'-phosphate decarboxylase [Bdellovibrionales bacterium GWA2_49_15]HAZ12450.1 orotidine-5'-phosphate decarboxylase [Bdellovibrionales bacterium]